MFDRRVTYRETDHMSLANEPCVCFPAQFWLRKRVKHEDCEAIANIFRGKPKSNVERSSRAAMVARSDASQSRFHDSFAGHHFH